MKAIDWRVKVLTWDSTPGSTIGTNSESKVVSRPARPHHGMPLTSSVSMADEENPQQQACRRCDCCWIVTTKEGWLKLVEAIMTLITFVTASSFPDSFREDYDELIFMAAVAFFYVVVHIIFRTVHVFEEQPAVLRYPILGMFACSLALILLIGSAEVFARGKEPYTDKLKTSGICGFISAVLFFCEGVYFFFLCGRLVQTLRRTEETTMEEGEAHEFVPPLHPAN